MKGVDTIARIRREFFIRGRPIKEIVRELHVSRNTVRKVVRSGATALTYERDVQPLPKLGQWRADLDRLLLTNAGKGARERLTLMRVFEALRGLGYDGGYDAVRRYARTWRRERSAVTADAYVPLSFAAGEAYQFDWSHEVVLINGVTVKIKVAHVRLCHSRMLFVRAYPQREATAIITVLPRQISFGYWPSMVAWPTISRPSFAKRAAPSTLGIWRWPMRSTFGGLSRRRWPAPSIRLQHRNG